MRRGGLPARNARQGEACAHPTPPRPTPPRPRQVRIVNGHPVHAWEVQGGGPPPPASTANPMRSGQTGHGPGHESIHTPGVARWAVTAAVLQLLATILILVGSAVWSEDNLDGVSAGAIVLLTGFTLWMASILISLATHVAVSTVLHHVSSFSSRKHAWSELASSTFLLVAFTLYLLASIALVVRDALGAYLLSAILYIVGSVYALAGWAAAMRGAAAFTHPLYGYTTAAYATGAGGGGDPTLLPTKQILASGPTRTDGGPSALFTTGTAVPVATPLLVPAASELHPPTTVEASTGAPLAGATGGGVQEGYAMRAGEPTM